MKRPSAESSLFTGCVDGSSCRLEPCAIDFWEDHCTECGEPDCFRTCPKFRRGAHGRCERVLADGDAISFREWGKLELLWSGRLGTPEAASRLIKWNRRREAVAKLLQRFFRWVPVPYGRGPYGIFRSLRWRKAARMSRIPKCPTVWIFEASSTKPISLAFDVRTAENKTRTQKTLEEWTGRAPEMVAWPFGRGNTELDARMKQLGLVSLYTRQGYELPFCRNMAIEGVSFQENLGRVLGAWPKVREML